MIAIACAHSEHDDQRRAWVLQQRRLLAPLRVEVIQARGRGCWPTNRDAIQHLAASGEPYGLWLQDDMLPVPGFPRALQRAVAWLNARGPACISFFTMRRVIADQPASLIRTPDGCWGGTILARTSIWISFLNWERRMIRPDYNSADRRLALYLIDTRIPCYVTNPSLIEHVGASQSLMGHSNRRRVAAWLAPYADAWQPTDQPGAAPGTLDPAARQAAYKEERLA